MAVSQSREQDTLDSGSFCSPLYFTGLVKTFLRRESELIFSSQSRGPVLAFGEVGGRQQSRGNCVFEKKGIKSTEGLVSFIGRLGNK